MEDSGFGERLRAIRGSISQENFAKSIGKDRGTIISWEQEKHSPKESEIRKIWKIYKMNCHWLITGESLTGDTDQPDNPPITTAEEHRADRREQIEPLKTVSKEILRLPARTRYTFLCCILALFFFSILKISNDVFFVKLSVLAFLTCTVLSYFYLALPYVEKWFYRSPKNLGT
jgi:transcriptional regulator with XRE-family HTH domain